MNPNGHDTDLDRAHIETRYELVRESLRLADWDDISARNHQNAIQWWILQEER